MEFYGEESSQQLNDEIGMESTKNFPQETHQDGIDKIVPSQENRGSRNEASNPHVLRNDYGLPENPIALVRPHRERGGVPQSSSSRHQHSGSHVDPQSRANPALEVNDGRDNLHLPFSDTEFLSSQKSPSPIFYFAAPFSFRGSTKSHT